MRNLHLVSLYLHCLAKRLAEQVLAPKGEGAMHSHLHLMRFFMRNQWCVGGVIGLDQNQARAGSEGVSPKQHFGFIDHIKTNAPELSIVIVLVTAPSGLLRVTPAPEVGITVLPLLENLTFSSKDPFVLVWIEYEESSPKQGDQCCADERNNSPLLDVLHLMLVDATVVSVFLQDADDWPIGAAADVWRKRLDVEG